MPIEGGIIYFLHSQRINTVEAADESNEPPGNAFHIVPWLKLTGSGSLADDLQGLFMPHVHGEQIGPFDIAVAIGQQLRFAPQANLWLKPAVVAAHHRKQAFTPRGVVGDQRHIHHFADQPYEGMGF